MMDYFHILNLSQEPFSNSPDPGFLFQSRQHRRCLQEIELSLRLRRGLNIIVGEVGAGKTTLCRHLIRQLSTDPALETHLLLDPHFVSEEQFLKTVAGMLTGNLPEAPGDTLVIKEEIKGALFQKGVEEGKTVILVIDEGQKLPAFCLETLREFLNYETNTHKLLQIVIFAQNELEHTLRERTNFADRISLFYPLGPLDFKDTRALIHHRLAIAGGRITKSPLFSLPALWAVYRATGGVPRKIIHLCHRCLLTLIVQNETRVGWGLVRTAAHRAFSLQTPYRKRWAIAVPLAVLVTAGVLAGPIPANREQNERPKSEWLRRVQKDSSEDLTGEKPAASLQREIQATAGRPSPVPAGQGSQGGGETQGGRMLAHYPYSIYLGAFRTRKLAEGAMVAYVRKGLSPYWVKVDLETSGVWYRVFLGHFRESAEAEGFLLARGLTDTTVKKTTHANLIGIFSDDTEIQKRLSELRERGFSPYMVENREGEASLYVGAYITKVGAIQGKEELKTAGIQCEVTER